MAKKFFVAQHLLFNTDGVGDLGAQSSQRPDKAYVKSGMGIGLSGAQNASAMLQMDSTSKGFLMPRMTLAQRNAIGSPVEGLIIYNTESDEFNYYDGVQWTEINPGGIVGSGTDERIMRWDGTNEAQDSGISISDTHDVLWASDASGDIGASGANRPNDIRAKNDVYAAHKMGIGSGADPVAAHDYLRIEGGAAEVEHMRIYVKSNTADKIPAINFDIVDQTGLGTDTAAVVSRWNGGIVSRVDFVTPDVATPGKDGGQINFTVKKTGVARAIVLELNDTGELEFKTNANYNADLIWATDGDGDIGQAADKRPGNIYATTLVKSAANIEAVTKVISPELESSAGLTLDPGSGNVAVSSKKIVSLSPGTDGTDAVNKNQLDALESVITNFEWQPSALNYVTDNTAVPASENSGDRYILSHDGGAPHANYDGASAGDIVEFDGSVWQAVTPTTGTFVSADDEQTGLYLWTGSAWSFKYFEATTASTGLTKVGFDVRLDSSAGGAGLGFAAGVLSVNVGDGLEIDTDTLRLKASVAGAGLAHAAGVLSVNVGSGLEIDTDVVKVDLAVNPGLEFDSDDLRVKIKTSGGVVRDADGLSVTLSVFDTDALSEGSSNLYFTDERVDDRVAALIQDGTGLAWTYVDASNTLTGNVSLTPFDTDDLSEGSNLYFTDERAQDAVGTILADTSSIDFTYTDATPEITAVVLPAGVDHNSLANVGTGDVHTMYALLAGRSGGQTIKGGIDSGDDLILQSTNHATKGDVIIQDSNLLFSSDGAKDLGADGASRPNKAFIKSEIHLGSHTMTEASVQTTDAVATDILAITLDDDTMYSIEILVSARRSDVGGDDRAIFKKVVGAYRENAAGAAIPSPGASTIYASDSSYDVSFVASGNDLKIQVTGAAAEDVEWRATVDYQKVSAA